MAQDIMDSKSVSSDDYSSISYQVTLQDKPQEDLRAPKQNIKMNNWVSVQSIDDLNAQNCEINSFKILHWRLDEPLSKEEIKAKVMESNADIFGFTLITDAIDYQDMEEAIQESGYDVKSLRSNDRDSKLFIAYKYQSLACLTMEPVQDTQTDTCMLYLVDSSK